MKAKIALITVLCDDVPKMLAFYRDVLGFETLHENHGNYVEMKHEGVRFALCSRAIMSEATGHPTYKLPHQGQGFELAFPLDSAEEVDRAYEEIVAKGATPIKAPELMPWGMHTSFFADPEGNIHELFFFGEPTDQ